MPGRTIEELRGRASGAVITSEDEGYEEARRVYNAMIDRRPRVVVRCTDAGDVAAAVDFARENNLAVAVRGGGHSVPGFGTGDDAVVADLSGMQYVTVDPGRRTARAQGGPRGEPSTTPPMPMAWPPPGASSPPPASAVSPWAGALGTSPVASASPATT
jgi:FAD binding domain